MTDDLKQAAAELVHAVQRDWPGAPTHRAAVLAAADKVSAALAAKPTDAELERRTGEPHVDGWPLVSGLPAPQAPVALTVDAITRCWGQSEGTRNGYGPFARAVIAEFCRINNITAPKDPANDR